MPLSGAFRVNSPKVIYETIDGEVIIVNLDSGSYYSLRNTGADLWNWMAAGATSAEMSARLSERYEINGSNPGEIVAKLVAELQAEELIMPLAADAARRVPPAAGAPSQKLPLELLQLSKYTDMQDLLVLDPIHEVDEAGWPAAKPAPISDH